MYAAFGGQLPIWERIIIPEGALTVAHSGVFIQVVARWTAALEATEGVDAFPALAQPGELLALINIYQEEGGKIFFTIGNQTKEAQNVHT